MSKKKRGKRRQPSSNPPRTNSKNSSIVSTTQDSAWYAAHDPYCNSRFYDWVVTPADLGEIDTEDSIDINSLFGEVMS